MKKEPEEKSTNPAHYFAKAQAHFANALQSASNMKEAIGSLKETNERIVLPLNNPNSKVSHMPLRRKLHNSLSSTESIEYVKGFWGFGVLGF